MNTAVFRLCLASFVLALAVVVLGAFTRLVDAGLGCPDWPTCYGHMWVPVTEGDVARANAQFAETPVEHDKTWPEQLHRIIASTLGLFILAIFYLSFRQRESTQQYFSVVVLLGLLLVGTVARIFVGEALDPYLWLFVAAYFLNLLRLSRQNPVHQYPLKLPAFIAGLVILQGLFGMWTVTLNLWPQVVTLHLAGGFATLSLLWLLLQRLARWHWQAEASQVIKLLRLQPYALALMVLVIIQILLGGWVSSNYAALACPDFPLCQNSLWPDASFSGGFNMMQEVGPNYLGGLMDSQARTAIHLTHRVGALLVTLAIIIFGYKLWASGLLQARNFALLLGAVLTLQLSLGILNIVLSLPLAVAVAHNAIGAVLLMVVVTINHRLRTLTTR